MAGNESYYDTGRKAYFIEDINDGRLYFWNTTTHMLDVYHRDKSAEFDEIEEDLATEQMMSPDDEDFVPVLNSSSETESESESEIFENEK